MPMQFKPYDDRGASGSVDVTLCDFLEPDPEAWTDEYNLVIEEYMTCLGPDHLHRPGPVKERVLALLHGLGRKFSILPDLFRLVQARLPPGDAPQDAEQLFSMPPAETCLMAQIRNAALQALQSENHAQYLLKKALWMQNYERIKYIFELRVAKILYPPVFLCITQQSNVAGSALQIQERTADHLNHMYKDLYYVTLTPENVCQKSTFLPRWLGDDTKRTYMTCAFDPKNTIPHNFNTYVAMRAATLPAAAHDAEGVAKILNHIKEVFCNDNQEHASYILRWMANIVKFPWKKTEVLLLLFGVEGCGKSMIIDFFANMVLGPHLSFQTATPGIDVFGKFAVGTHRKLLCFCDEGGEELGKYQDMLKNLITAKAIRVEKKGQDIRLEDNYTNVIVASNNAGPVRISSNDRRVVAFHCSDKYKDNQEYFSDLAVSLASDVCARAFYDYLLAYDVEENYAFQAHRPITAYYESLMATSLPIFWRFWSAKCLAETKNVKTEQARTLHREFLAWKTEREYECVYTEARFGRELNELVGIENSGVTKVKRSTYHYQIDFDTLRRYMLRKRKFDENAF